MTSGVAAAAPSLGSSDSGSVSSGSVLPEAFQSDPGPPPVLRDDILTPTITQISQTGTHVRFDVASKVLRRVVSLDVLRPAGNTTGRPTLYMLDGVSAADDASGWMYQADAEEFFADKNINVVMLNGGRGSLYTDWNEIDPVLGLNMWESFITDELPPLINDALDTNGVNAIAGNSMGAQSAMMLAHRNPTLYSGVAAYSGCFSTIDAVGRLGIQLTTSHQSGDPANVWGDYGNQKWRDHDSVINAQALENMDIYISVGSGIAGPYEQSDDVDVFNTIIVGGAIEVGANRCTHVMEDRLEELGIPATIDYEPVGVHAWPYWKDQLPKSWPTLARALDV